ncbi:MAG: DUF5615 family PIN-like protein [Planctomycetes bacterium]|nr:DUF5615 family PIN-like protein [Planctomycetota bacterium]
MDDDSASHRLAGTLRQAGHDVELPADVGLSGEDDAVHLAHAILLDRVLLSRNYDDFGDLHDLIMVARGHHPGIFLVRRNNGGKRSLSPAGIVRAITRLLAAGVLLQDQLHVLNQWQ